MLSSTQLKTILIKQGVISKKELDLNTAEAKKENIPLEEYLISKKFLTEEDIYHATADYYKVPFVELKNLTIRKDILLLIPEPIAQTHKIIAFDKDNTELKIAAQDPQDLQIFEFLRKKTGLDVKIHLTTPENLSDSLKQYHKGLKAEFKNIAKEGADGADEGAKLKELADDLPVIRIVDTLLEYVRYRVDGILKNVMTLPKSVHLGVVARIKILSLLKLDEHRLPQDGRFKIVNPEYKVSFRVSIMPTYDGEKIVMRLLNEKASVLTLEQLGFQPKPLDTVKRNIKKPHGMVLVTGPTGSGKTTTLYTILNLVNKPEVNICTIEDPIEYRLPHINQSQVNPKIGFTFAGGLRAFLRQDPDIIMVGEIRDKETSEIAVHAAMTGHLVLSTLHTNDAVTTLPRLVEMGTPAFLIASTTNVIIAQRLVRKICQECIESYNLDKQMIKELEKQVDIPKIMKKLEREKIIIPGKQTIQSMLFYRGKGCKQCNKEGYKGRLGIYEVLEITDEVASLISKNAHEDKLREAAENQGMISILEDGFIKANKGITTLEEVMRVTKE